METYDDTQRAAYEEFIEHLSGLEQLQKHFPDAWKTSALSSASSLLCPTCGIDLHTLRPSQRYTTYLVPLTTGGPKIFQNNVLMCASCAKKRGTADITDPSFTSRLSAPLPAETLRKRSSILLQGGNHLTSLRPKAPREKVQALLEKRYEHPRFRVFAHASSVGCFIGYRMQKSEPQAYAGASALLRHVHKAAVEERGDLVLFRIPHSEFMDAVWAMIETNGLVVAVHLKDWTCEWYCFNSYDWRKVWTEIYDRFDDNRRRYRTRQAVQPWAPRELSTNKDSIRSRNRNHRQLKETNLRGIELRQAAILEENARRWINEDDPGSRFSPSYEVICRTFEEAHYWRLSASDRRIYLLDNPQFKAPSLEPDSSLDL